MARICGVVLVSLIAVQATRSSTLWGQEADPAPSEGAELGEEARTETPDASTPVASGSEAESPEAANAEATGDDSEMVPSAEPDVSLIDEFLNGSSRENITAKAGAFYTEAAVLENPFGRFEGKEAIVKHLSKLYGGINTVSFEIKEEFVSGEETVALWTMSLSHKDLNNGDIIMVEGVSHVRFENGKALTQHDYYDAGALVYEHTPLIGRLVRWVKGKIVGSD